MKLRFSFVGAILSLVCCCLAVAGCAREDPAVSAAMVGEHEVPRELVGRWAGFDKSLRVALGLPARSPQLIERAALQTLVEDEWIRGYARIHDIDTPSASTAVLQFKKSLGVDAELFRHLQEEARLGGRAIQRRAVAAALDEAILKQYLKQRRPVPEKEMVRYYQRHSSRLGRPEKRTVRFIVSASEDEAQKAKKALERGGSWASLAEQYSVAEVREQVGWQLKEVTALYVRGMLSQRASRIVFTAPPEELIGPRTFEGGQIVFEVANAKPASRPPFLLVRDAIRTRLIARQRDAVLLELRSQLRAEFQGRTSCAVDYKLSWCRPLHS